MSTKKERIHDIFLWIAHHWDRVLFLVIFAIFIVLIPGQNIYTTHMSGLLPDTEKISIPIPKPFPYPENKTGVYPGDEISATGVVVLDVDSGVFLYKRNADMSLSPASTTKIVSALVVLDSMNLDDIVTVKEASSEGQVMGLFNGERISVENLLYGLLIHSGNDAGFALAEAYPGGLKSFVSAMNHKAQSLHLTGSTFTNPVGFDDPNHKMTALDLARLSSVALRNRVIAKMVAIPAITISDATHTYYHSLKNVNQLLGKIPGVSGIKTGWTEEAGENLVTFVERDGKKIIFVVLRSKDRFADTIKLIDWAFTNYTWKSFSQ
jgi:serine-type D-Ala-D-Ala carboxypeptidase (penicillin-binding protein 5/6)